MKIYMKSLTLVSLLVWNVQLGMLTCRDFSCLSVLYHHEKKV